MNQNELELMFAALKADLSQCVDCCKFCRYEKDAPPEACEGDCSECKLDCWCRDCRDGSLFEWRGAASTAEGDQGAKADAGKLPLHLVPMQIVRDICEVRQYGNRKYGDPENWRQIEMIRYVDALLRHTLAFAEDINGTDEESGIPHYKHIACNVAFICEMMRGAADENGDS